jgi:DNA polymerase-4
MGSAARAIAHLNIIGFRAAVAALVDRDLRNRPYVIAGGSGGRAIALDVSPQAMKEGIKPGIALAAAQRIVRDLAVVAPDPAAYGKVNAVLEKVISGYAPAWQNDGGGNIYLDISGTRRLFGPPTDCVCHVQNEIYTETGMEAAAPFGKKGILLQIGRGASREGVRNCV